METTRYKAYNSTRGTVLNSKLSIANRELEPLKFLELLIGGLGLDSESGLWLKPLAGAPQVPRVFPFDLVYLDINERVIQFAEIFPSSDFPPYSDEIASAMVLPLHAASLSQTRPGDLLTIQDADGTGELQGQPAEAAEQVPEVMASAPEAATEVAVPEIEAVATNETADVALPAVDAGVPATPPAAVAETTVDAALTEQVPEVMASASEVAAEEAVAANETTDVALPAVDEGVPATPAAAAAEPTVDGAAAEPGVPAPALKAESKHLVDVEVTPPVVAADAPGWEVPMEGFWTPPTHAEGPSTKESASGPKQGSEVSLEADKPQPQVATPSAPDDSEKAGSAENEKKGKASGTTASTSRPVIQSEGFTFSQYRNWQVTTATPPAAALKSSKPTDKGPAAKEAVDSRQNVAQPEGSEKIAEKASRNSPGGRSTPDSSLRWSEFTSRAAGKPGKPGSNVRRSTTARKGVPPRIEEAELTSLNPKGVPETGEAKAPTQTEKPTGVLARPAIQGSAPKDREPSLPLWKISPNPAAAETAKAPTKALQDLSESTKAPAGVAAASEADSGDRVKLSKPPVEKVAKKPVQHKVVVEAVPASSSHASRVPEAISKLMTVLHRIGGGEQQPGKQEVTASDQHSSWLIPEALHRDRRRAVRRIVPGLVAYYFTGGAPQPYTVSDISASGFFLVTRDQWMPETMILMTLQKPIAEGKQRRDTITVLCKVVRRGEEGIGVEFVMPETLDPHSRDIKPSRATDRSALAKFLFSGGFEEIFDVLDLVLLQPVHQTGEQIGFQENRSLD